MKILKTLFLLLCLPIMLNAKEYYVATNGNAGERLGGGAGADPEPARQYG